MAIMEISVVPIGKGPSVSRYVAGCVKLIERSGLKYILTPMGSVVEGDSSELLRVALLLHKQPFLQGAKRVLTSIKIDERVDKTATMSQKIKSVKEKL